MGHPPSTSQYTHPLAAAWLQPTAHGLAMRLRAIAAEAPEHREALMQAAEWVVASDAERCGLRAALYCLASHLDRIQCAAEQPWHTDEPQQQPGS